MVSSRWTGKQDARVYRSSLSNTVVGPALPGYRPVRVQARLIQAAEHTQAVHLTLPVDAHMVDLDFHLWIRPSG
jgi:hypothetical protein